MAARLQHIEYAVDLSVIPKGMQANNHEMPKMRIRGAGCQPCLRFMEAEVNETLKQKLRIE